MHGLETIKRMNEKSARKAKEPKPVISKSHGVTVIEVGDIGVFRGRGNIRIDDSILVDASAGDAVAVSVCGNCGDYNLLDLEEVQALVLVLKNQRLKRMKKIQDAAFKTILALTRKRTPRLRYSHKNFPPYVEVWNIITNATRYLTQY